MLVSDDRADKAPDLPARAEAAGAEVYRAPAGVLRAVAGFNVHRGMLALASVPPPRDPFEVAAGKRLVLVVEAVNDHENLGALFRNAAALGAGAVLLDPRAANPLYRRSVRVSLGHVLRVPFARLDPWPESLAELRRRGVRLVALSPSAGRPIGELAPLGGPLALMVGSEGDGLTPGALAGADEQVRIPMAPGGDSVNVATAAAIALHEIGRWRAP